MANKILFDLECTQPSIFGKRHGGGIYGEMVLRKLVELDADLVVYYNSQKWLNPEIEKLLKDANVAMADTSVNSLSEIIDHYKPDTLYSALPEKHHSQLPVNRRLGTLHGLRTIESPNDPMMLRFTNVSRRSRMVHYLQRLRPGMMLRKRKSQYADLLGLELVVVSNHTAYSLRSFFPETAKRDIPVFYSPSTTVEMELNPVNAAAYPYFLMVSGNRWEKNTLRAIMAFDRLFDAGLLDGIKVHITGLKSLKDIRYKYRHPERFVAMGYVDDDELQRQYRDAYGFIYPSLNEGFGYPPVEAMRFGVPTAASGVCSIPEVCGDAVLYFNPLDIAEISNRILQLTDTDIRKQLHNAGLERYQIVTERQNSDLNKLAEYIMNKD